MAVTCFVFMWVLGGFFDNGCLGNGFGCGVEGRRDGEREGRREGMSSGLCECQGSLFKADRSFSYS